MSYASLKAMEAPNANLDVNNPLSFCSFRSLDSSFLHGSGSVGIKPSGVECMSYMADKCSDKWDGFCRGIYETNQRNYFPNTAAVANNNIAECGVSNSQSNTIGGNMLRNSLERKFIRYHKQSYNDTLFDPNMTDGAKYRRFKTLSASASYTVHMDPSTIDNDDIVNMVLKNPYPCADVLARIYGVYKRGKLSLGGTRLGKHLDANSNYYGNLLKDLANAL